MSERGEKAISALCRIAALHQEKALHGKDARAYFAKAQSIAWALIGDLPKGEQENRADEAITYTEHPHT